VAMLHGGNVAWW